MDQAGLDADTRPAPDAGDTARADAVSDGADVAGTGGSGGNLHNDTATNTDSAQDAPMALADALEAGADLAPQDRPDSAVDAATDRGHDEALDTSGGDIPSDLADATSADLPVDRPVDGVTPASCKIAAARGPRKLQSAAKGVDLTGLAFGNDGVLWVAGQFYESGDFGFGQIPYTGFQDPDVFLAKLDPTTNQVTLAKGFGQIAPDSTSDQVVAGSGVAVASNGSVCLIGSFTNEIDFSARDTLGTVSPNNPDGTIGTAGIDFLTTPNPSGANYFVVLDASGAPTHAAPIDMGNGALMAVASNPNVSAFAVCGKADKKVAAYSSTTGKGLLTTSFTYTSGDGMDVVVAKIDSTTGQVVWGREFGGVGDQSCQSVAVDNNGDVIVAGGYNGALQFGTLQAFPDPSDSTAVLLYVARFAGADGTPIAATPWGSSGKVFPYGVTVDGTSGNTNGNIILAGSYTATIPFPGFSITSLGQTDAFVAKLTPALAPLWVKTFGDAADNQQALGVATASNGGVYVAGSFTGSLGAMNLTSYSIGNSDGFVAQLAAGDGAVVCAQRYGDDVQSQLVGNVAVAPPTAGTLADSVAIGGAFSSRITFGSTVLDSGSANQRTAFVSGLVP